jgi:hypothetical protein
MPPAAAQPLEPALAPVVVWVCLHACCPACLFVLRSMLRPRDRINILCTLRCQSREVN